MDVKTRLLALREQIARFMQLHNNPFDTSKCDHLAEQLKGLDALLAKLPGGSTPTTSGGSISDSVGINSANKAEDVRTVQTLLNQHGASLTVDGQIGNNTINAIKDFQRKKGLTADGIISPNGETFAALKGGSSTGDTTGGNQGGTDNQGSGSTDQGGGNTSAPSISGSVGEGGNNNEADVRTVQELLNQKGASLTVDGQIGTNTINAIKSFQRSLGSSNPDGRVDVGGNTWKGLIGSGGSVSNDNTGGTGSTDGGTDGNTDGNTGGGTPPVDGGDLPPAFSATSRISGSVGQGGQNNPQDVTTVSTILKAFYSNVQVTSSADSALIEAIKRFQREYRGSSRPDGRVDAGGGTWNTMLGIGRIQGQVQTFARQYSVEPAVILAIQQVESGGNGFLPDGRPRILFEGHIFWSELQKVGINPNSHVSGNGDILYPSWTRNHYKGGTAEYSRLDRAKRIHEVAALKSASWGEFQVMGFNHSVVGYSDVKSFVEAMHRPGGNQLSAVMEFCKNNNLLRHVQGSSKNWASFARGYNGPGYAQNAYDKKLADAYARFSRIV